MHFEWADDEDGDRSLPIVPGMKRLCAQGSSAAYNALGIMHLQGLAGMPVNHTRAKQLFEIGASMGEPDCFYNLAVVYSGAVFPVTCGVST